MFGSLIVANGLRDSGQQLRQDDPSALKDIVQIVQSRTSGGGKTPKYVSFNLNDILVPSKPPP
jgi:hypothetical protein